MQGKYVVKFGVLFDDEFGQQYYEAIVGTLKAAKKKVRPPCLHLCVRRLENAGVHRLQGSDAA